MKAELKRMDGADLRFVLNWRNHPRIRMDSGSEEEISEDDHRKWFDRHEGIKLIFIYDDQPTGIVRFDLMPEEMLSTYQWSFYLDPFREHLKGTGKLMLTMAIQFLRKKVPNVGIIGQVKMSNTKSIRIHEALGFQEVQSTYDLKFRRFFKLL